MAQQAVHAAHVEAESAVNGIGFVKLMGRSTGHIALHATFSSRDVDCCLIPENDFYLEAHAWITVSKSFQTKELLKEIIKKLYREIKKDVPVEVEEKDTTDLKKCISDFLQPKRYVIVLDDIWDQDAWEELKYAFPNNDCGSRVIITTRDTPLSSFACNESNGKIHNLLPLSDDESRTLFCQKVFQSDSCPPILEETTKAILKKCEGLPLAIVAIGGLLSTKGRSIDEWDKIYRGLGAELRKKGKLSNLDKVLSLSYFDLPWHLKLCFLYLSVFPEDYPINHWLLIRLWIAEGFVLPTSGLTEEEVAGSYLTELTDRSLIQIKTVGLNGREKEYHIHDIWRELIISRSSKHDLVSIYGAQQNNSTRRVRRLAIHNKTGNWQKFKCPGTHIRSLLMFGSEDLESMSSIVDSLGDGAKLLKVLDMRYQGLQTFPRKIGQLLHLKYLSLRGNYKIKEIPKSIGNLQMLETLDLKYTGVRKLPNEILKLHRLRHLLVGDRFYKGFIALKGMKKLLCLETLYTIKLKYKRNNDDILRSISKLTRLRKVGIMGLKSGDAKELCSTVEKLTELRSLYIYAQTSMDLERLSSPPKFLKTLGVSGEINKLPKWIASLHYLTKLKLIDCKLKEELCFKAGTFKQLVRLKIGHLYELKHVSVMEGAMPRLKDFISQLNSDRIIELVSEFLQHTR